jgi:hypothetical protein
MKRIFSSLIIIITLILTTSIGFFVIYYSLDYDNNNYQLISSVFARCYPVSSGSFVKPKKIVLRIDDVQDFAWSDISERMIYDSINHGIRPVIGVIPHIINEDKKMDSAIEKNACNLEVAMHGDRHSIGGNPEIPEFGNLSYNEAKSKVDEANKMLKKISKKDITTFIPPQNEISSDSLKAINDDGIKIISSEGDGKYDYTNSTFNWETNQPYDVEQVIEGCKNSLERKNVCIIMTHPQDFADGMKMDEEKYKKFIDLLDELKKIDADFVTFSDMSF